MIPALRKRHIQPVTGDGESNASDAARAAAVCRQALNRVKVFAELSEEEATPSSLQKVWQKAGGPDGCGVMLRLAAIDTWSDSLSPPAMAVFVSHGEAIMEMLQSLALNFTVFFSLFLTIFTTLLVMHAGSHAYSLTGGATNDVHVSNFGDAEQSAAWSDLASYCWPEDADAQRSLRRHLYLAEVVTLVVEITVCLVGLAKALLLYGILGPGLPLVSKLEVYVAHPTDFMFYNEFDVVLFTVPVALGFTTARASALASLASFSSFGALMFYLMVTARFGFFARFILAQHKQARIVCAAAQRSHDTT